MDHAQAQTGAYVVVSYGSGAIPVSSFSTTKSPALCRGNAIDYADEAHLGIWTQTGDIGDTDESDSDGAARLAHDWVHHRDTFPATDETDWYVVFYVDPNALLDWIHISSLRFINADDAITLRMYLWDDDLSTWDLVETWTPLSFSRDFRFSRMLSARYTNVERLRLRFTTSGTAFRPRMTEIMFMEFFQFEFPEHMGSTSKLDLDVEGSGISTGGGHWIPVQTSDAHRIVNLVYKPVVDSDDKTNIELFFRNVGLFPFLYVDDPTTNDKGQLMRLDPFFSPFPLVLPKLYSGQISMREIAPTLVSEGF